MFFATGLPGWLRPGPVAPAGQTNPPALDQGELKARAEALQAELDLIKKSLAEEGKS
jgi:hypothetical protein